MDIGKRIREGRELKGWKSKDFAALIKIDSSQYSKIESGKLLPTLLQIIEIGNQLELSLDWLILGKKNIENSTESNIKDNYALIEKIMYLQEEIIELKDKNYFLEKRDKDYKYQVPEQDQNNSLVAESKPKLKQSKG